MPTVLQGQGVSGGMARGEVLRVENPTSLPDKRGEFVIVTSFITPILAPLLMKAKALLLEYGGITAHGASVAREFGIPCVVQIPIENFNDGIEVEVNGTSGTVTIL